MVDESHSFAKTRVRLEEIVAQVRKKDTSLEKSLDLLEEGVRLANQCTELIDHADWEAAMADARDGSTDETRSGDDATSDAAPDVDANADTDEAADEVADDVAADGDEQGAHTQLADADAEGEDPAPDALEAAEHQ